MNDNKKNFVYGFIVCLLIFCLVLNANILPQVEKNVSAKDNFFVIMETQNGKASFSDHNVITDIGENRTGGLISDGSGGAVNPVDYISIGNATAGTGLTQLTSEYDRQQGASTVWMNGGDYAFNLTKTWTFTETVNLDCAGSHWDSSGDGNLYAVANFVGGAVTFNINDNLTIIWVKTYNCN